MELGNKWMRVWELSIACQETSVFPYCVSVDTLFAASLSQLGFMFLLQCMFSQIIESVDQVFGNMWC